MCIYSHTFVDLWINNGEYCRRTLLASLDPGMSLLWCQDMSALALGQTGPVATTAPSLVLTHRYNQPGRRPLEDAETSARHRFWNTRRDALGHLLLNAVPFECFCEAVKVCRGGGDADAVRRPHPFTPAYDHSPKHNCFFFSLSWEEKQVKMLIFSFLEVSVVIQRVTPRCYNHKTNAYRLNILQDYYFKKLRNVQYSVLTWDLVSNL